VILSPTQIEQFDPSTPFGCKRKWWFERVGGRPKAPMAGTELGTAVHSTLETFLKGGPQGGLHDLVIGAPGALEWLMRLRTAVEHIEFKVDESAGLKLAGVPVVARIDWTATHPYGREIGDHKTTSNIAKYAKTPGELKRSIQMNIYAYRFLSCGQDVSRLTQDFYQTKGAKKFLPVSVEISKPEIQSRILEIESTVEEIVKASKLSKVEDLEPNEKVCNIAFGCPHRAYCPRSGEINMASLLDMFKAASIPTPPPAAALSPDAPASDPKLAADPPKLEATKKITIDDSQNPKGDAVSPPPPVPAPASAPPPARLRIGSGEPAPTPPSPKRPGRPPGAKNKPKEFAEPPVFPGQLPLGPPITPQAASPVEIDRITIRHGARVGLPNYSSATVEVEMSALVRGPLEEAKELLSLQCKALMRKELEVYTPKPEVKP
jgi:CRISPR/Cas system-associated exonuclease Cas4 (RecB family)